MLHAGMTRTTTAEGKIPPDALRQEIQRLAAHYSIEVPAYSVDALVARPDAVPAAVETYVPALPKQSLEAMVSACVALVRNGFTPVPHIAARSFTRRSDLESLLDQLADRGGVEKVLVIGGDYDHPLGPFASAQDVLATGLLTKFGFREVAISGYPDGHLAISAPTLRAAFRDKLAMARAMGLQVSIVTQFSFEAGNILAWGAQTSAAHPDVSIALGVPGPARLGTLLRYAKRCGVQAALRAVGNYRASTVQLLAANAPDQQIVALAKLSLMHPGQWRPHFFTFGGTGQSIAWITAVQAGRFQMSSDGSGFSV